MWLDFFIRNQAVTWFIAYEKQCTYYKCYKVRQAQAIRLSIATQEGGDYALDKDQRICILNFRALSNCL